jgi:tetratricopeptide (TPR) repeat protein
MKPLIPVVLLLLGACAGPGPEKPSPDDLAPDFGQPGEAGYHVFMAEIALQRELPALAATEYLRASRVSDDPEIAERATRVTDAFGTREEALQAAERWAALAPDDPHPRHFLVRAHVEAGDVRRATAELAWLRAAADTDEKYPFLPLLALIADLQDQDAALAALSAVAADDPDDASAAYATAYLALRMEDFERGQADAARALALDPGWTEAALLYARSIAAGGRPEEALDWLAARPEADDREVRLERAVMLMAAERMDDARALLLEILAEQPADGDALRALGYLEYFEGRPEEARAAFEALLESGQHENDALFYLGGIAEQEGDIELAAQYYSRISGGENVVTAQVRLALLMYRMGRPELAINHLEMFARRNPAAEIELGAARAELLVRLGLPDDALDVYAEILERHPEEVGILYSRALLNVESGQVEAALEDFARVLALRPDDPTALNALGYTLADMTDRHKEAYRLIRRAHELEPDSPAILDSMAWVLYRLGRSEDALPYAEQSWEAQQDPEIAAHLGEILWSLGRKDEARDVWLIAIVEAPESEVLLETMGRLDP